MPVETARDSGQTGTGCVPHGPYNARPACATFPSTDIDAAHAPRTERISWLRHTRRLGRSGPAEPGRDADRPRQLREEGRRCGFPADVPLHRQARSAEQDVAPGARGVAALRAGAGDHPQARNRPAQRRLLALRGGPARTGAQPRALSADRYAGDRRLHRGALLRAFRHAGAASG